MEAPNTVPRILRTMASGPSRVILSYDGASRSTDLLDAADRLGVWATFDARDDIRGLVDLVRRGLSVSPTSPRNAPALDLWHLPTASEPTGLTARERDVIQLLCVDEPLDTERAAQQLGFSVHTLNVHLRNVRENSTGAIRGIGGRFATRSSMRGGSNADDRPLRAHVLGAPRGSCGVLLEMKAGSHASEQGVSCRIGQRVFSTVTSSRSADATAVPAGRPTSRSATRRCTGFDPFDRPRRAISSLGWATSSSSAPSPHP